jgi:hypothetical protein
MLDLERTASRGSSSLSQRSGAEKDDIAMWPLLDQVDDDASVASEDSFDSAQAGVKRAEAISSTWSSTGLYCAYFGSVYRPFTYPQTS